LNSTESPVQYQAKHAYRDPERYVPARYTSTLGRIRLAREYRIFRRFCGATANGQTVLDCPHGVGRLAPLFREHGLAVVALDASREMLLYSRDGTGPRWMARGLAEALPLRTRSVDWVFSFALMKHLPPGQQVEALAEFARTARRGVLASFAIWNPLSFGRWWLKQRDGRDESFPLPDQWVRWTSAQLGLRIDWRSAILPGLGMETVYMFRHDRA
jgi:SAM-dependent methyltransferase